MNTTEQIQAALDGVCLTCGESLETHVPYKCIVAAQDYARKLDPDNTTFGNLVELLLAAGRQ